MCKSGQFTAKESSLVFEHADLDGNGKAKSKACKDFLTKKKSCWVRKITFFRIFRLFSIQNIIKYLVFKNRFFIKKYNYYNLFQVCLDCNIYFLFVKQAFKDYWYTKSFWYCIIFCFQVRLILESLFAWCSPALLNSSLI